MNLTARTVLAVIAATILLSATPCHANFNVSPMVVEIEAAPGDSYSGAFDVVNGSSAAEPVHVFMENWDMLSHGEYAQVKSGGTARMCSGWVTLGATRFDAPGGGRSQVNYTVNVPRNAEGSYWTFVLFEGEKKPEPPANNGDGVQVFISTRIRFAVRLVVNVAKGSKAKAAVGALEVAPPPAKGDMKDAAFLVNLLLNNSGNTYVKTHGYVEIRNLDGASMAKLDVPGFYVFPGHDRWVSVPVKVALPPGEYLALNVIDYGGDELVAGETHFTSPVSGAANQKK